MKLYRTKIIYRLRAHVCQSFLKVENFPASSLGFSQLIS